MGRADRPPHPGRRPGRLRRQCRAAGHAGRLSHRGGRRRPDDRPGPYLRGRPARREPRRHARCLGCAAGKPGRHHAARLRRTTLLSGSTAVAGGWPAPGLCRRLAARRDRNRGSAGPARAGPRRRHHRPPPDRVAGAGAGRRRCHRLFDAGRRDSELAAHDRAVGRATVHRHRRAGLRTRPLPTAAGGRLSRPREPALPGRGPYRRARRHRHLQVVARQRDGGIEGQPHRRRRHPHHGRVGRPRRRARLPRRRLDRDHRRLARVRRPAGRAAAHPAGRRRGPQRPHAGLRRRVARCRLPDRRPAGDRPGAQHPRAPLGPGRPDPRRGRHRDRQCRHRRHRRDRHPAGWHAAVPRARHPRRVRSRQRRRRVPQR